MIAGFAATRDSERARRSIEVLSGGRPEGADLCDSPGGPLVWLPGSAPGGAGEANHGHRVRAAIDGRIFNLGALGAPALAGERTPAQCVAALWSELGTALLDRLVGDFTLAMWDPVARELALATDPLGQSSLHYAQSADRTMFAFASGTRTLRALDWVDGEPNDESVVAMLRNTSAAPDASYFRGIGRLPGGHLLRWRDGQLGIARYWGPRFARPSIGSVGELLEAFEATLRDAVADRLDPGRPTAIMMSGGYDSTAVAGMVSVLARARPDAVPRVAALSGTFGDLPCSEDARIDAALAANGLPGLRVTPLGRGIDADAMRRHVARHDAPLVNFQAPFFGDCFALAREHGFVTLMTGLGGDELTVDNDYAVDFARAMGPWRFPYAVRRIAAIRGSPIGTTALRLARALCPDTVKRPYRSLRRALSPRARAGTTDDWLTPHAQSLAAQLADRPPLPEVGYGSHSAEIRWQTATHSAVEWARQWIRDEMVAEGFAFASPWLDRRLFELVLGVDARFLPRTWERGEFKPLIARGLPYMPPTLVGGHWEVEFNSYNVHVLQHSLAAIEDWLFGSGDWRSERFVTRERALAALARFRAAPLQVHFNLMTIVGLETWLRSLDDRG